MKIHVCSENGLFGVHTCMFSECLLKVCSLKGSRIIRFWSILMLFVLLEPVSRAYNMYMYRLDQKSNKADNAHIFKMFLIS